MSDQDITTKKVLSISSADRISGTPSNFVIDMSRSQLSPKYVGFHSVELCNQFFNVNANSNTLSFVLNVTTSTTNSTTSVTTTSTNSYPITVSIPVGSYNVTTLTTQVQNSMNSAAQAAYASSPSSLFTVTSPALTGFTTISTNTSGYTFNLVIIQSLDYILGFRPSTVPGITQQSLVNQTSITSPTALDLRSYPVIFVRFSPITPNYYNSQYCSSVVTKIQNYAQFAQSIFSKAYNSDQEMYPVAQSLSSIQIQLTDEYGMELPCDLGLDWSLSLMLYG